MKTLVDSVFALPASERLDHALFLIGELTGNPDTTESWLRATFKLTVCETRAFCALNAASPRTLSKQAIYTAIYGAEETASLKLVDVYLCKLRAKMGDIFETVHSVGYSLPEKMTIPTSPPPSQSSIKLLWTVADDTELFRMKDNGSDVSAIAYELDRTERAVLDRLRKKATERKSHAERRT